MERHFFMISRALNARKRKIFALFFALAASIGLSYALTPLSGDVWDEDTKTLTVNSTPQGDYYHYQNEIKHVVISSSVTEIGEQAFSDCLNMESVVAYDGLQVIDQSAFFSCQKLESVILPSTLREVRYSAFASCDNLKSVTINAPSLQDYAEYAFDDTHADLKIYVPEASVDTYKSNWSAYADHIVAIGSGSANTVTWNRATIEDLDLVGGGQYSKDGVTLRLLGENCSVYNGNFSGNGDKDFEFSVGDGKVFTSIVITCADTWGIWTPVWWHPSNTVVSWSGNAASVKFGQQVTGATSIVFTIGDPAPDPTEGIEVPEGGEIFVLTDSIMNSEDGWFMFMYDGEGWVPECQYMTWHAQGSEPESRWRFTTMYMVGTDGPEFGARNSNLVRVEINFVSTTGGGALAEGWTLSGNKYIWTGSAPSARFYHTGATISGITSVVYVFDGKCHADPEPDVPSIAENGVLPGVFSISATTQAKFSQANLQYQASTQTWQFAAHQYDMIGEANGNVSSTYDGWIDVFGWGTGNNPTKTSLQNPDYGTFVDWGTNAISNGGNNQWRTLTKDEMNYLCFERTNAANLIGYATIAGTKGTVILPDNWTAPDGITFNSFGSLGVTIQGAKYRDMPENSFSNNKYTKAQWAAMEAAGAVFFPAAGKRSEGEPLINNVNNIGYYWTSTPAASAMPDDYWAYSYMFASQSFTAYAATNAVYRGYSVRLVGEVVLPKKLTLPEGVSIVAPVPAGITDKGNGVYEVEVGTEFQIQATVPEHYSFVGWSDLDAQDAQYAANPRTITMNADMNISPILEVETYTLTLGVNDESRGSVKIAKAQESDTIYWDAQFCYNVETYIDHSLQPVHNYNSKDGITVTMEGYDEMSGWVGGFFHVHKTDEKLIFTSTVGDISKIIIHNSVGGYPQGWIMDYDGMIATWEGTPSATVELPGEVITNALQDISMEFIVGGSAGKFVDNHNGTYTVDYGTELNVIAVPAEGYHLASWSNGAEVTSDTLALTVTGELALTANFAHVPYMITLPEGVSIVAPVPAGITDKGNGVYEIVEGTEFQISADIIPEHYHFGHWADLADSVAQYSANPRTIVAGENLTIEPIFAIDTYTLTLATNDSTKGVVSVKGAGSGAGASVGEMISLSEKQTENPVMGEYFQVAGEGVNYDGRIIGQSNDYKLTISSQNGEKLDFIVLKVSSKSLWSGYTVSSTAGDVEDLLDDNYTIRVSNINATSVTISRSGTTANPTGHITVSNVYVNEEIPFRFDITDFEFPNSGNVLTGNGVTLTAGGSFDLVTPQIVGGGTFTTDLGNFTKIEIYAMGFSEFSGEGWTEEGDYERIWTGNASSVSFDGAVIGDGMGSIYISYTIALASAAATGIVDNGDGTYTVDYGTELTFVAKPAEGYMLASWNGEPALSDTLKLTMTEELSLTANFKHIPATITLPEGVNIVGMPIEGITDKGEGVYEVEYGTEFQISADSIPEHYHFDHWADLADTTAMYAANPRTIVAGDNLTVESIYAIDTYTLTLATNDSTKGVVSLEGVGAGQGEGGTMDIEWDSEFWNSIKAYMNGEDYVHANNSKDGITITFEGGDFENGLKNGEIKLEQGNTLTFTSTVGEFTRIFLEGYVPGNAPEGWDRVGGLTWEVTPSSSAKPSATVVLPGRAQLVDCDKAVFTIIPAAASGIVDNGDGTYTVDWGTELTFVAKPAEGFMLESWSNGAEVTSDTLKLTMTEELSLTANFKHIPATITLPEGVNIVGMPIEGITAKGEGVYEVEYGTEFQISADGAPEHYHFDHWADLADSAAMYAANPRTIVAGENLTIEPIFAIDTYTLTLATNDSTKGVVSVIGAGGEGEEPSAQLIVPESWSSEVGVTITAADLPGFVASTEEAVKAMPVPTEGSVFVIYNFKDDGGVEAVTFENGEYVRTTSSAVDRSSISYYSNQGMIFLYTTAAGQGGQGGEGGEGIVDNGDGTYTVDWGTELTFTAKAADGYHVQSWSNGAEVNDLVEATQTITMTEALDLSALFAENPIITLATNDSTMGIVTLAGAGNQLTVAGSNMDVNQNVPIRTVSSTDTRTMSQSIYPAALLSGIAGDSISGMTYYISEPGAHVLTATYVVKLMETEQAAFSDAVAVNTESATTVYTGTIDVTGNTLDIVFDQPYAYNGGNLLVEFSISSASHQNALAKFSVFASQGGSFQQYYNFGFEEMRYYTYDFLAKTTFICGGQDIPGVIDLGNGQYNVLPGTELTFVAQPAERFMLDSWSNGAPVNGDSLTITVTEPLSLTANFKYIPAVITLPEGVSIVEPMPAGITALGEGVYEVEHGTEFQITATGAPEHYHFGHWADLDSTNTEYYANPRTVVADTNFTADPFYTIDTYTLTLASNDTTMGKLTIEPADGIVANGDGTYTVDWGTELTFVAQPAEGFMLDSWSNGAAVTSDTLKLTMTEELNLTANFKYIPAVITLPEGVNIVEPLPAGITDNGDGTYTIEHGTEFQISADGAPEHYHFDHWTDLDSTNTEYYANPRTVVADTNFTANPFYTIDTYTLTLASNDTTMGKLTIQPAEGIVANGDGTYTVDWGTEVTFVAVPAEDYHLLSWSNGAEVTPDNKQVITLTDSLNISAFFKHDTYMLTVKGAEVEVAKFYDGTNTAVVTNPGTLIGVQAGDSVKLTTTATFSSADIANNLDITLHYAIEVIDGGIYDNEYALAVTDSLYNKKGFIIESMIPDTTATPEEEEAEVKEGIEVYGYGYCADGNRTGMLYHLKHGNPNQYKVEFEDARFADVDWTDLDAKGPEGVIYVTVPVDVPTGDYKMTVTFRDHTEFYSLESAPVTITFHVNLPETYVVALFDNVMAVVDTCECLTDIQWYWRADSKDQWQAIPGATGYYYKQEGGLSGEFFIKAKMNGVDTYTCPQEDLSLYADGKRAKVTAYPNPVQSTTTVTIENSYRFEHDMRIINLMGNEVLNTTFEGNTTTVEMNMFPQGSYIISVDGVVVNVMKK